MNLIWNYYQSIKLKQVKEEKTRDQSVTRTTTIVSCSSCHHSCHLICKIMVPCHVLQECFICHAEWPSPMLTFFSDIISSSLIPPLVLSFGMHSIVFQPKNHKTVGVAPNPLILAINLYFVATSQLQNWYLSYH